VGGIAEMTKRVDELLQQIETALRWIRQMQGEIQQEGHAGWSNTLDDIAILLRDLGVDQAQRWRAGSRK